jgi:hypothetical protein
VEVLRVLVIALLGILVPWGAQAWDARRLSPQARQQAWNGVSQACALFAFGPLSMLGWVWVTRVQWDHWRAKGRAYPWFRGAGLLAAGALCATGLILVLSVLDAAFVGLAELLTGPPF